MPRRFLDTGYHEIDSLFEGIDYLCSLARTLVKDLCMDYLCESMGLVEPNRSIGPDKTMNMVLQCRAQSSQVKVLHNCRNRCYKRDSFAHYLETAGGVLTSSSSATVSFTRNVIEEASAQVEGADSAPSVVEAARSEAAPMGDQGQQMAETAVTDEAEAAGRVEKTDWPRRQLRQMRRTRPRRNLLLQKQLSLPARLKRSVKQ